MLDLRTRKQQRQATKKLPEGAYDSVVVDVHWSDDHEPEKAFEVVYQITDENGSAYQHSEIFFNDERNKRTTDFEDYLVKHGIYDLVDFVGKRERLSMGYVKSLNGREYFNIKAREFVDDAA